jgi:hypothetical protein
LRFTISDNKERKIIHFVNRIQASFLRNLKSRFWPEVIKNTPMVKIIGVLAGEKNTRMSRKQPGVDYFISNDDDKSWLGYNMIN